MCALISLSRAVGSDAPADTCHLGRRAAVRFDTTARVVAPVCHAVWRSYGLASCVAWLFPVAAVRCLRVARAGSVRGGISA